ncbi:MAG TPA: PspC domain-containing protein [Bacteroidales bacterium]|nr:PspC domain-containing protein [Bacteroidales bacterium]
MNKTVNINLGGTLFQIDEEAYLLLNDYINAINARFRHTPGGIETIEDIEYRIAEIFRSRKGLTGVVSRETVEYMISVIGKPEEIDSDEKGVNVNNNFNTHTRRLFRNPENKVIAGVASGLGAYLNVDPVLFRILFILVTFFAGAGLLIYLVMWIAVPSAETESAKMEMYGNDYNRLRNSYARGANNGAHEIISMTGRVFFVIFRIVLIFFGTALVLTGFTCIMVYTIIFILNYPNAFTASGFDSNINYLQMLHYMLSPASSTWMLILISLVILLPLVALVYWGTRMIFWFKARDGYINLAGFVLWIMAITGLTILFFREGVSFAETSFATTKNIIAQSSDTLYLKTGRSTDEIDYDQKFMLNDHPKLYFFADSAGNMYLNPSLRITQSEDNTTTLSVQKRASARTKKDAERKAESIDYNYKVNHDTLILDQYFSIPQTRRWSGDFVKIRLSLPENTILRTDDDFIGSMDLQEDYYDDDSKSNYWIFSEGRLRKTK